MTSIYLQTRIDPCLWENRRKFLRGQGSWRLFCRNCGEHRQGMPEDIDEFAREILDTF